MSHKVIDLKILKKTIQVNCPVGSENQLHEAAEYLEQRLGEIRHQSRVLGSEQLAIIAALNITHELLSFKQQKEAYRQSVTRQIECLQNKIDNALIEVDIDDSNF